MPSTQSAQPAFVPASRQIALDNIWLKPAARWGHTQYSLEYHKEYLERHTGIAEDSMERLRRGYDRLGMDFLWHTQDGLVDWGKAGRVTDMGHASYATDGSDLRQPVTSPFATEEEVWAFDAVGEYGLPDFEEQVRGYEGILQAARQAFPNQLTTGGYYKTIVSGAIEAFGWDMLLLAAADIDRMEQRLRQLLSPHALPHAGVGADQRRGDHPARRLRVGAWALHAPGHLSQGPHPALRRAVETAARRRQEGALLFGRQLHAVCRRTSSRPAPTG